MKHPKVAVVVLNYKGWRDSVVCIESLVQQTYPSLHIVLIENGSKDQSARELSKLKDPRLTYMEEPVNHGFTGGVNIGIRWAIEHGYDAVALLNNDAHAEPDWLEKLVSTMTTTGAAMVTSCMLSADGKRIDDAGDGYSTWGIPLLRSEGLPTDQAPDSGYIFGATGGATLYATSLFEKIGLFDNVFFAYNEDVDISWRAQLSGHTVYYEKSAIVYHKHSATSKKIPGFTTTQVFQNLPIVLIKNVPFPMVLPVAVKFVFIYWAFVFHKIMQGAGKAAFRGVWRSVGLWPHAFRERRAIQRSQVVSNAYIKSLLHKGLPLRSVRRIKHFFKHPFKRTTEFDY